MRCPEKWRVRLKAELALLSKLSEEFSSSELLILQVKDCWFLESIYLQPESRTDLYNAGETLIDFLNRTLWLYAYKLEPIKSDGYFSSDGDDVWTNRFTAVGTITAPARLIICSNEIPNQHDFDLFAKNLKVKEALALLANPSPDWFTLFKIYEIVRDDEPDIPTTKDGIRLIKNWTGADENLRFFKTANWHRHSVFGKTKDKLNEPPRRPMSLPDGARFIRTLLKKWLKLKREIQSAAIPD